MQENYYPVDFEAQYEETSEKMIEISKKYKDLILNSNPDPIEKIQNTLQGILIEIQQHDLLFRKQSIYSQFAPGQLMAERRKQPPEMCPECGQELKKTVQCQFCAELFCKKCCSRSRVIPFVSKQSRLCCQQCHYKFVKLFDNKNFYEEKEKLVNVINFTRNKTNKVFEKISQKKEEVEVVKNQRRNERIKQKNMEKKIQEEEKKVKQLEDEFRAIIANKAKKIIEAERRKEKEEQERKIKAQKDEEQKLRRQQQEKAQREAIERKQAEEKRRKEQQQQLKNKSQSSKKSSRKEPSQKSQKASSKNNKSLEAPRNRDYQDQESQHLDKPNPKQKSRKSKSSFRSVNNSQTIQTPKHVMFEQQDKKQHIVDTAATSSKKDKSRRQSEDMSVTSNDKGIDANLALKPSQSEKKSSEHENDTSEKQSNTAKASEEPEDALERSLSRMLKLHKEKKGDDDNKSMVSGISKTSKNIIDMTVNELLGLRIPTMTNRTSSKGKIAIQEEQQKAENPSEAVSSSQYLEGNEEGISPVSPLSSRERSSIKMDNINDVQVNEEEIIRDRNQIILRNSTLISSTKNDNKSLEPAQYEPKKCECLIM